MAPRRQPYSPRPTIRSSGELRSWMLKHRVFSLDAADAKVTVMHGLAGPDKRSMCVVPKDVMRQLDGEIVWLHDEEGRLLPPNTLLGLRTQLRRFDPAAALKTAA